MDKNQKAAVIALISVVLLSVIAIGIVIWEVKTDGFPNINLPHISIPHKDEPSETFDPFNTPVIEIPSPSLMPDFSIMGIGLAQQSTRCSDSP